MKIPEDELIFFANDFNNGIEMGQCDTNAIKVYRKFGGLIYMGEATFIDLEGNRSDHPHFWNVLSFITADEISVTVIVDIINYKKSTKGVYINHRDPCISSIAKHTKV